MPRSPSRTMRRRPRIILTPTQRPNSIRLRRAIRLNRAVMLALLELAPMRRSRINRPLSLAPALSADRTPHLHKVRFRSILEGAALRASAGLIRRSRNRTRRMLDSLRDTVCSLPGRAR